MSSPTLSDSFDPTAPRAVATAPRRVRAAAPLPPGGPLLYRAIQTFGRFCWLFTIRARIVRQHLTERPGPYVLAANHLSHLEPFLLSGRVNRRIDWVTRIEFYRVRFFAWVLDNVGAIPVNRQGVPVSTVRTAIARLRAGRVVGICPEGGVVSGDASVCRGGRVKRGVCLLAQRAGAPIVPCVVVGSDKLNAVEPWLPLYRARLWIAFGPPLHPDPHAPDRKRERARLAVELEARFRALYQELCTTHGVRDADVP